MTKQEFDNLPSDGKEKCPKCGLKNTEPYPGCGCPSKIYYTLHINKYHHNCEHAAKSLIARASEVVHSIIEKEAKYRKEHYSRYDYWRYM